MRDVVFVGQEEAGDVEQVGDHVALDVDVERRVGVEAGRYVHLEQPRLEVVVQQNVEAEQLVDRVAAPHVGLDHAVHGRLGTGTKHRRVNDRPEITASVTNL